MAHCEVARTCTNTGMVNHGQKGKRRKQRCVCISTWIYSIKDFFTLVYFKNLAQVSYKQDILSVVDLNESLLLLLTSRHIR